MANPEMRYALVLLERGGLPAPVLRRVLDYIDAHLAQNLTLHTIAAQAGYSPYHFTRLFKQSTGHTLHAYVIERRVNAARTLLADGQLSVAEVAAEVGFHDQSHLCRHVRGLLGVCPTRLGKPRKNLPNDLPLPCTRTGATQHA